MSSTDTIVALSSGRLPAGVAVVRMSGPATRFVLETMVGEIPQPRHARLCVVRAADGQAIDRGLVLFFPGPASFTGEDCAELHLHGGRAVVSKVLESLADSSGVRLAEAGEFTRRAFLNGKLDLLQAEALADLVSAETEAQRRLAMRNSEGAQTALYQEWRHTLLRSRALIEAELDFSDEQDVPGSVSDTIWPALSALASDMARHIDGYKRAEMVRDGFEVVIVGRPNAGKSSLLNVLARRDVAIVSDEPGTTRDLVEVVLDIGGMKVRLVDTAGLREGGGMVETLGIERAVSRAQQADLVIRLYDMSAPDRGLEALSLAGGALAVGNKLDLAPEADRSPFAVCVSCETGEGVPELLTLLGEQAALRLGDAAEVLPSRLRHVALLKDAERFVRLACDDVWAALELRAEHLRLAGDSLGRISGAVDVEELLGVIFSSFCIGK